MHTQYLLNASQATPFFHFFLLVCTLPFKLETLLIFLPVPLSALSFINEVDEQFCVRNLESIEDPLPEFIESKIMAANVDGMTIMKRPTCVEDFCFRC